MICIWAVAVGLKIGLGLGLGEQIVTCPIWRSNSVTVLVTLRRYRQTNSAQALKEGDRFTRPIPRTHVHTQRCHAYV